MEDLSRVMDVPQVRVSPPKLGGVAAAKPQTGWFPIPNFSKCILEMLQLRNHTPT
jgi:hypothetical protein